MNVFFEALKRTVEWVFPQISQNFSPSGEYNPWGRDQTAALVAAGANGIEITGPVNGWLEVGGAFSGLTYLPDDGSAPAQIVLGMGDMVPFGPSGKVRVFMPSGAVVNEFRTKSFGFGTGLILAGNRSILRAIITGPTGLPTSPASQFAVVVTAGGAVANQTYTRQATNIGSTVVNRGAGILYLAESAAKATTLLGVEIQPGAARKWVGPMFYATSAALTFDVQEDLSA